MAESLIRNQVGSKSFSFGVPATSTDAQSFADALLDGTYQIFEKGAVQGTSTETEGYKCSVMIKNDTTKEKTWFSFDVGSTVTSEQVETALIGKTINGISIDSVLVTRFAYTVYSA